MVNTNAQEADLAAILREQTMEEEVKEGNHNKNDEDATAKKTVAALVMNKTLSLIEEEEAEEYMT